MSHTVLMSLTPPRTRRWPRPSDRHSPNYRQPRPVVFSVCRWHLSKAESGTTKISKTSIVDGVRESDFAMDSVDASSHPEAVDSLEGLQRSPAPLSPPTRQASRKVPATDLETRRRSASLAYAIDSKAPDAGASNRPDDIDALLPQDSQSSSATSSTPSAWKLGSNELDRTVEAYLDRQDLSKPARSTPMMPSSTVMDE